MKKFLFLYTEIAEYFLACCQELSKHAEVHIVRWPVNKEAPFLFEVNPSIKLYTKTDYSQTQLNDLVKTINPSIIICSGWIDKDYLNITKRYYKAIPTVMTCDTQWRGTLKQLINCCISPFRLLNRFSHAWVPGQEQKNYVLKLGFKQKNIVEGFYSCDLPYFEAIYHTHKEHKTNSLPKRFLFVGRYYEFKGLPELWQAFIELQQEHPNDWELWCLGAGDLKPIQHPKIKHFGFVQPKELESYIAQTGVFILPSRYEPWGVVVHEYAASGFPLLLSDAVGAKDVFLESEKNGFEFKANNVNDLKNTLLRIVHLPNEKLVQMSAHSHQLSKRISPKKWTETALSLTQ